jgi:hypothetical protein
MNEVCVSYVKITWTPTVSLTSCFITDKWELSHSVTGTIQGDKWGHKLNDSGYDNMLPSNGYSTPQEAIVYGDGAVAELWLLEKDQRNSKEKKTAPIPIRSLRISHEVTRNWTRGSAVRGQSASRLDCGIAFGSHAVENFGQKQIIKLTNTAPPPPPATTTTRRHRDNSRCKGQTLLKQRVKLRTNFL